MPRIAESGQRSRRGSRAPVERRSNASSASSVSSGQQEAVEDLAVDVDVVPDDVGVQRRQQRGGDSDPRRAEPPARSRARAAPWQRRPASARARPQATRGRTASRDPRGRRRRAAVCTQRGRPEGSRTSRSRPASGRSGRSSRRTPRGSARARTRGRRGGEAPPRPRRATGRPAILGAWVTARRNGTRSSPATSSGCSTTLSGSATWPCCATRRADFASPRSSARPISPSARTTRSGSNGRARPLRSARSASTRTGRRPITPGPPAGDPASTGPRRRQTSAAARPAADALLRRRLVHRRGRRGGMRRVRLCRLHAALRAAVVPRRRRRLGAARCPGAAEASFRCDPARLPDQPFARLVGADGRITARAGRAGCARLLPRHGPARPKAAGGWSGWRSACSLAGGRRPTSMRSPPRSPTRPSGPGRTSPAASPT